MTNITHAHRVTLIHTHLQRVLHRSREATPSAPSLDSWEPVIAELVHAKTTFTTISQQLEETDDLHARYLLQHHAYSLLNHLHDAVYFLSSSYALTHPREKEHSELLEEILLELGKDIQVAALLVSSARVSLQRYVNSQMVASGHFSGTEKSG